MNSLIVCTDLNEGIGINNTIPWYSSEDFKHFKNFTMGKKVLMGYKTWQSLPEKARPLPGRQNIIVTSRALSEKDQFFANMNGVQFIQKDILQSFLKTNTSLVIMGGAQIYQLCLHHVDQIVQSVYPEQFSCDAFFTYPKDEFEEVALVGLSDGVEVHYLKRVKDGKVDWQCM